MRKILALTAIAGAILVAACNTVEGAGKDVKSAGENLVFSLCCRLCSFRARSGQGTSQYV